MKTEKHGDDFLELFPHGWATLVIVVLPGIAYYLRWDRVALVLLIVGIVASIMMATYKGRHEQRERRYYIPKGFVQARWDWVRQPKLGGDQRKEFYPLLIFCLVLAWWVTTNSEHWTVRLIPAAITQNPLTVFFLAIILLLLSGLALINQLFPALKKLTGFYALLLFTTLLTYYTQTLPLLLKPLGWELTVLAQRGNWAPTSWPLVFAGLSVIMIGAALMAWPSAKGRAWGVFLQEAAIRGLLSLLWMVTSIYILGRAMAGLYSPPVVYSIAIGVPLALFILFSIEIDVRTPMLTIGSVLRLLLVSIALTFYGLLFLFTKVGDFLVGLYMRLIRPSLSWLDKLRNWIVIQIELLRIYRDWLITMIFDTSRDDLFKEDEEIRDLADSKLLD